MSKIVKLTSAIEREEKLNEIYENLEELKNQFTALIDEYEEEKSDSRKVDTLIEALDALEDAAEAIQDVLEGDFARMGAAALETIRPYTVENMVQAHRRIFDL